MPDPQTQTGVPDGWEVVGAPSAPPKVALDSRGKPIVSSDTSDSPMSAWFETHLRPALESAAHPRTVDDVVHLLMSPTDATRGLGIAVVDKALGTLKSAAKAGAETVKGALRAADPDLVSDAVGLVSPRLGHALSLAQRLKGALTAPEATGARPGTATAPPAPATPSTAAPVPAPPATTAPLTLTEEEWQALQDLVSQGHPRDKVLQAIAANRAPAPAAAPPAPAAAVAAPPVEVPPAAPAAATPAPGARPKLSAAEAKEVLRLKALGKSPAEIESLIDAQRQLQRRFGLASPEATRQAVSQRNASGRWADEP